MYIIYFYMYTYVKYVKYIKIFNIFEKILQATNDLLLFTSDRYVTEVGRVWNSARLKPIL